MRVLLIFLAVFLSANVTAQYNILFVGNSLTYYNDLPEIVRKIGRQENVKIKIHAFLKPNYSLEDHWKEDSVSSAIRNNHYDFVVMQQGPSGLKSSRENLVEYAMKFAEICKRRNSKMAFYMVWPSANRAFDFPNVIKSYAVAADTTKSILCPAGKAWLKVWALQKDFPLYSADGFHPSEQGSLLAAMIVYGSLFGKHDLEFISLKKLSLKVVTPDDFSLLKNAATAVLSEK